MLKVRFYNSRDINKCRDHKGLQEVPGEFPVGQNLGMCGECHKTFFRDNTVQMKVVKGVRKLTIMGVTYVYTHAKGWIKE
ncbi:MAG TPA: hypothetical protein VLG36_04420 [Candidatus Chromulinivoraceae bacterium]|nr:hypothetical protein [Candidatus Chromulinivoraceae bacterium]